MTSLQAGQRALSLSANVRMVSTAFIKDTGCTGILRLLLLGILLPSVLVSGQTSTLASSTSSNTDTTSATAAPSSTTQPPTSVTTETATTTTTSTTISGSTATSNTQPSTSPTSTAATTTTIQSSTMTSSSTATPAMSTSQAPTTTTSSGSTGTATTQSTMSTSSGVASTAMTQSSASSMTSGSGSSTSMMSTSQTYTTGGMNGTNTTLMSMIYCPSFTCNYSDCYTVYNNQNVTSCTTGAYCQLIRQADMRYTVGCSASCVDRCVNASQINCSVNCCNSTGCLNGSFASMMMTTTTVISTTTMTKTTTQATTTTKVPPTVATSATPVNNGKKCHKGNCNGTTCYTSFGQAPLETCTSSQPHCQLKKETINSILQWTAGCTTNCSGQTTCKTGTTQASCHLECCNATVTSCLWLNGTLNVPSFATRGPHLNTELIASLFCLVAITLLL